MKRLLLVLVLACALSAPAWAGFDEGVVAYKRGDYETALRELRPLAERGNPIAQSNLGVMYAKGQGVAQDYAEAVKWWRRATEQGFAEAQFNLGNMYDNGLGVAQDYAEAAKWYRRAAEQDYAKAQYNLGVAYEYGEGVEQDYVQAHMWYNLAASRMPAGNERDGAVEKRDNIEKRMTPAQEAEAQKLAREWKP